MGHSSYDSMQGEMTLHILVPSSDHTPESLVVEEELPAGDVIADLRRFSPLTYQVGTDQTCLETTGRLFTLLDYWQVARDWLAELTRQTNLQRIKSGLLRFAADSDRPRLLSHAKGFCT